MGSRGARRHCRGEGRGEAVCGFRLKWAVEAERGGEEEVLGMEVYELFFVFFLSLVLFLVGGF